MESELSPAHGVSSSVRVLRIEIVSDPPPNSDIKNATVARVRTLRIKSRMLATKSPFFYKLFSNGTTGSELKHVTLRINASEEAVLMKLLRFMCSNPLNAPPVLYKFEVSSCRSQLLPNLPMAPDSPLLYVELPHTILMADAAKQYLAGQYKDLTKFKEEVMALPLSGIEVILASDHLRVKSEDDVYDFVLKWARQHYKRRKERREVLGTRLGRLIRFPYMTCRKLEKVLICDDFTHKAASKLVFEALFFKAQQSLTASASLNSRFVERAYKYRPVKVVEFEVPRQQCVVYLDLKREECAALFPSGRVKSQTFHLCGRKFLLLGACSLNKRGTSRCFELAVGMKKKSSGSFVVDCEFAARSRPAKEFVTKYKSHYTFTGGTFVGTGNLFKVTWSKFMAEDSPFFINGVLHLKAEFTVRH
ncbi:BTB/POZ domain-containing protein POB1-like isoform X1 [Lotus japonicus]|nr:BTB/POZ domain-containing protein POB1-like isoform X1 [Lotus japonicus]